MTRTSFKSLFAALALVLPLATVGTGALAQSKLKWAHASQSAQPRR